MEEFFQYLVSLGITSAPDVFPVLVSVLDKSGIDGVRDIAAQCYILSEARSNYPRDDLKSVFKFSVGSSVSGGVRPCAEVECRVNNLYDFATFCALYAQRAYIPNPFEHVYERLNNGFEFASETAVMVFVNQIAGDIAVMFNFKPLLDQGILRINPQVKAFCNEHWEQHVREAETFQQKMKVLDPILIRTLNEHVRFELGRDKTIVVQDPERYTNMETFDFIKFPENLVPYLRRAPHIFSAKEVEKLGIWEAIVVPAVNEVIFQKYSMFKQDAAYLTSYGLEKDIINGLNSYSDEVRSKELFDALVHELPFVSNVTIESLVQLRSREAEAFEVYRDQFSSIIRNLRDKKISAVEAREIVQAEINPHLHKIDQLIKNNETTFTKRAAGMIVFDLGLAISAGVFGNWEGVSKIGGLYTIKDILGAIFRSGAKPPEALNDNYFFLWSVRAKAGTRH